MGFLFPLFLLAGLTIAIPLIIHLVNLRQFKKELFPNVRFLRELNISSKQSSKLRRKWLLLSRILFLLALVLAFAQPVFKSKAAKSMMIDPVQVLYLDNSMSMSLEREGQTALTWAKEEASNLVRQAASDQNFVLVTCDRFFWSGPLSKEATLAEIKRIELTPQRASLQDFANLLLSQSQQSGRALLRQVYIFSDFQKSSLVSNKELLDSLPHVRAFLYPIQGKEPLNAFVDSVWLPMTDSLGEAPGMGRLAFRVKRNRVDKKQNLPFKVQVNDQTVMAQSMAFSKGDSIIVQSLPLEKWSKEWLKIAMILDDQAVAFDDTFRLATHVPSGFSALVLSSRNQMNPYLLAAFKSMPGVNSKLVSPADLKQEPLSRYSLIVVQDGNDLDVATAELLKSFFSSGGHLLFFPGREGLSRQNEALNALSGLQLSRLDTSRQEVVVLEKEHPLIKDLFLQIPEQVQLPMVTESYPIQSGASASRQDIMSFASGQPLLTQLNMDRGVFYLVSSPLSDQSSNFPLSYFFAPILYKMTIPSGISNDYHSFIGSSLPIWMSGRQSKNDGGVVRLIKGGQDWIPQQKVSGRGLAVYAGQSAHQAGFYYLVQGEEAQDTTWLGMNHHLLESKLNWADPQEVEATLMGAEVFWLNAKKVKEQGWHSESGSFPLWKVALILALIALMIETGLLLRGNAPKTASF